MTSGECGQQEVCSGTIRTMAEGEAEWELSKENIQPLRQGRSLAALQQALTQQDGSSYTTVQQQRQVFESELRMYTGDDPLDVWDRYIKWTQQVFPQGGKESNLSVLLERAVILFANEKRYHNDPRYVNLWIKHAENITEPLEIYSYMHTHSIGVQLAAFYIAWSEEFEKHENFKKADSIYQLGISCGAEPADKLHQYHKGFQARVSRQVMAGMVEGGQEEESSQPAQPQRSSLADLKPKGKKTNVAPIVRVGASVSHRKRGLSLQLPVAPHGGQNSRVMVFDENQSAAAENCEPKAEPWIAPPTGRAKENELMPEKWTDVKMPQKFGHSVAPPPSKPTFQPFVEECDQPPAVTPCKINPTVNTVLSARKPAKEESTLERLQQQHVEGQPKEQSMYCKELLFSGVTEFCFEELRAERYYKKVSQELEEKTAKLKAEKENLKQQIEAKQKLLREQSLQPHSGHQVVSLGEGQPSQQVMECTPETSGPLPIAPLKVYDETKATSTGLDHHNETGSAAEQLSWIGAASQIMQFTIFDENTTSEQSQDAISITATSKPPPRRALSTILKPVVESVPKPENEALERLKPLNEDSILGSYRNKTLCPSPEDTHDFMRALHLASTPSSCSQGQRPPSDVDGQISTLPPFTAALAQTRVAKLEDCEAALREVKQLSPIQETSMENGYGSSSSSSSLDGASCVKTMHLTYQSEPDGPQLSHTAAGDTAQAHLSETVIENPSSSDSRRRALEKVDLDAFPNFFRKAEPLPTVMEGDVLFIGDEAIVIFSKITTSESYTVYFGQTQSNENVVVKVDCETVPWDFYIHAQLKARLGLDSHKYFGGQSKCFLYNDGCITLHCGNHRGTLQDFLARCTFPQVVTQVAPLALELLEMVQKMHNCHLVHGDIRPGTLHLRYREALGGEDSVLKVLDFSHSVDLDLQLGVTSIHSLPGAQTLLEQGVLSSASSPYQVDLLGIAETVYMMLERKSMTLVKKESEWRLEDDFEILGSDRGVWQEFFRKILNPESTVSILTELQELLKRNFNDCVDDQLTFVIKMAVLDCSFENDI
ncbi:mitotic checkpoint serine/threonine-protein kinase BUB1 beta [Arapaima gigas]